MNFCIYYIYIYNYRFLVFQELNFQITWHSNRMLNNMEIKFPVFILNIYRDGNNYKCSSNHIISCVVCMCMNDCVFKYSSSEGRMSNHLLLYVYVIHTTIDIVNMTCKLKLLFHTARMFSMEIAVLKAVILGLTNCKDG